MKSINYGLSVILGVSLLLSSEQLVQAVSPSSPAITDDAYTYTVQEDDTLWSIASEFNVTVHEIRQENNMTSPFIFRGQEITIPKMYAEMDRHRVQPGDTLYSLAREHELSVADIQRLNHLDSHTLHIGQMLVFDEGQPTESTQPERHPDTDEPINDDGADNHDADNPESATMTSAQATDTVRVASVSSDELDWLARIIEAEARGEPYAGKVAVGSVVLNRVDSDQFPDSIYDVIFQRTGSVHQFTPVANGRIHRLQPTDETYEAAQAALNGEDPTGGALYFYNPDISSDQWIRTRSVIERIGDHVFAY